MGLLESLILGYPLAGYLALLIGIFLEGEVVFLTATIFAADGHLSWRMIVVVSLLGLFLSDLAFYYLGRYAQESRLGRYFRRRFLGYNHWIDARLNDHFWQISVFSKFIYVINKAVPFLGGWHGIPFKRFLRIQIAAGIVWVGVMLVAGNFLGLLVDAVGVKFVLKRIEIVILIFIGVFIVIENILKRLFSKRISETK